MWLHMQQIWELLPSMILKIHTHPNVSTGGEQIFSLSLLK
jgi:hypothetical protein